MLKNSEIHTYESVWITHFLEQLLLHITACSRISARLNKIKTLQLSEYLHNNDYPPNVHVQHNDVRIKA